MGYENLLDLIKLRRSVRQYEPESVPMEDVMKVLEAARWAASGNNSQPWEFVVVRDRERLREVTEIFFEQTDRLRKYTANTKEWPHKNYLRKVTTMIVVCADPRFKPSFPYSEATEELARMYRENAERIYMQSIAAAISNLMLAATSLGLGTVWLTGAGESITERQLKTALKIPDRLDIICCIPLGYPSKKLPSVRTPRPLESMTHLDEFDVNKWRTDQDVRKFMQGRAAWGKFYKTGRLS